MRRHSTNANSMFFWISVALVLKPTGSAALNDEALASIQSSVAASAATRSGLLNAVAVVFSRIHCATVRARAWASSTAMFIASSQALEAHIGGSVTRILLHAVA